MKKLLSVLLVMMMALTLLPTIGSAASYTVSGDGVIYKTPEGASSLVQYTLMDGTTKVTDGVAWSLSGSGYAGVSIDNAGKLKVTNAASGTFSVVATTADGSASKEVTISNYLLFEDFESKTAGSINADSVYEKGGAFFGPQSSIVEEAGNKYVKNFNNLNYTKGVYYNASDNCVVGAFSNNANYANSFTEMHTNSPKVITLEGKFRNSNVYAWDTPQWMFSLVFNNKKTGKPLYGSMVQNATQRETLRIISIKTNEQNQAYTISSNHNSNGAYTATTVDVPNVGSHGSTLTGARNWITARVTIDFEKYTYTVWAEDRIIYENYPLPEHATEGKVSSLSAWGLTCAADDLAVYSGYKNEMKDYDVAGDSTIYKTPQGTEAFVEYKLMDGAARITDGITWSREGNPVGVSIDNAGKLKVTNAASGTFTVVGTTAGGIGKKEIKISDYFLFEDFESKEVATNDSSTVTAPDKEKGGAFFGTRSGVREESAGGNKYGHGYQNLTYTTSIGSTLLACAFYGRTDEEESFTEMHETRPQVITLEGKFRNSFEVFENPQWMFALLFNAENGKPIYGANLNVERQANTARIIGVESNGANEAYTLIDYNGSDGTYDKAGTKIPGIGEHSSSAWGRKYWFDARITIDFEKQTYSLWAEDRVVFENYPLPSDAETGKAVSLSMWAYNCDADDVAIYSGYKNAANIPDNEMVKGEDGSFVIKGIVRNNNFLKVAKYENNALAEIFDASDLSLIGKHINTEVTIPNYDSNYQYKVFWWMPKLVPLADCIEFPAK